MKQLLRIFDNKPVRAVLIKGEPWFVGKDVCEVLGYANANDAMGKHCRGVAGNDHLAGMVASFPWPRKRYGIHGAFPVLPIRQDRGSDVAKLQARAARSTAEAGR